MTEEQAQLLQQQLNIVEGLPASVEGLDPQSDIRLLNQGHVNAVGMQ